MKRLLSILLLLIAAITHAQQPPVTKTIGKDPNGNVHCGLQDRAGNMWFGTTGLGVYRYDGKTFTNFTAKDGLPGNNIYTMLEDRDGNIWFGGTAGICRYNGSTFTPIPLSGTYSGYVLVAASAVTAGSRIPHAMLQDKDGKIWVGTSKGVYVYNGSYFTHFLQNDNVVNNNKLKLIETQSVLQDNAGNIWFTTWFEGVCCYDGKYISQFTPNGEVWFSALAEDKQGNIWIGRRDKGVCRYDGKTFTNILQHGDLDECGVSTMITDKAGNIWIGTESGELHLRDKIGGAWRYDGKNFTNFTPKDGLPHFAVFTILENRTGGIWFGTRNTGLCHYDGKTITNFSD